MKVYLKKVLQRTEAETQQEVDLMFRNIK